VLAPTLWYLLAAVLVLIGLLGSILPALPGLPLVFGGLLLAAWVDHFQHVGWPTLLIIGGLAVVGLLVDLLASLLGAKRVGASKLAVLGAALGTLVGIFFGLPGLLIGPFAGAVIGELASGGGVDQATRSGVGAWLGFLFGTIAKLVIACIMIGWFALGWLV
jgi:uncharacterized protein YqgC (DUF456 family)